MVNVTLLMSGTSLGDNVKCEYVSEEKTRIYSDASDDVKRKFIDAAAKHGHEIEFVDVKLIEHLAIENKE